MNTTFLPLYLSLLVAQLGSESWPVREQAHQSLATLGPLAVAHLEHAAEHPDPEIRHRARQLLAVQLDWRTDRLLPAGARWPIIDVHPDCSWGQVGELQPYMQEAHDRLGRGHTGWQNWRLATRCWASHQLAAGTPSAELRRLLATMAAREASECAARKTPAID